MTGIPSLNILVEAKDNASAVIQLLGANMAKMAHTVNAVGGSFKKLSEAQKGSLLAGGAMVAAGVAIIGFLVDSTKKARDYQDVLARLNTVLDYSPQALDQLGNAMLVLSTKTRFSVQDIAEAAQQLAIKGVKDFDTLKDALANAANVATALQVPMSEAASTLGVLMKLYPGMGKDIAGAADIIVRAVDSGLGTLNNFDVALRNVGPIAKQVGIPLHDVAVALATMTSNGATAGSAGSNLYQILAHLQPTTKDAKDWMQKLGWATFDTSKAHKQLSNAFFDTHGNMLPLTKVVEKLREGFSKLSPEEQLAAEKAMFTVRSSKDMFTLLSDGANSIENVTKRFDQQNTAQQKANQMNETLAGKLAILTTSWNTLQILLGLTFIPILTKLVQFLTPILNWFIELPKGTQQGIAIFLAIAGVLITVTGVVTIATIAFTAFGAAILAALWPVLLVVAAVAALVAIGILVVTHWTEISTFFTNLWKNISSGAESGISSIRKVVEEKWNAIKTWWLGLVNSIMTDIFGPHWVQQFQTAQKWLTKVWNEIKLVWDVVSKYISVVFGFIWAIITSVLGTVWAFIKGFLEVLWNIWSHIWGVVWAVIKFVFELIWFIIGGILKLVWEGIIKPILTKIGDHFKLVFAIVHTAVDEAMKKIHPLLVTLSEKFEVVKLVLGKMKDNFVEAFNHIKSKVEEAVKFILEKLKPLLDAIDSVGKFVSGAGNGLHDLGKNLGIPGFAQGGVVTSPTLAMVGEGGEPEAIIPFSKMSGLLQGQGHGGNFNLYLDGKVLTHSVDYHLEQQNAAQGGNRVWPMR